MLADLVDQYKCNVWLINTGWSGGKYGIGKRMSLKITRKIIDELHEGRLQKAEFENMEGFDFAVPKAIDGVDSKILMPVNSWPDRAAY